MFKRLHDSQGSDGQGVGLALCRKIIERHSCDIGVTSEPNVGSTFWFTLPLGEAELSKDNVIEEAIIESAQK